MNKIIFAYIILFFACCFSQCEGSASHYLPAVASNNGVIVNVTMELENGDGNIYFSVYPNVGISTQDSAKNAIEYAFERTKMNKNLCNVKIRAHLPNTINGYLDGPSGGAALALMGIAAIEKQNMRSDAMITGAISSSGEIGQVGGLYEKANIAKENGLKYFLTPPQNLYERITLRMIQQDSTLEILEIRNMSDAEKFMLNFTDITVKKEPPYVEELDKNIPFYYGLDEFKKLAREMMLLLDKSIANIDQSLIEEEKLGEYFAKIKDNEDALFRKGYYFSAANDAFINYLDTETIANLENLDINERTKQIKQCLLQTKSPQITDTNLEWVAGQELRKGWAEIKLSEIKKEATAMKEEKYAEYHNAIYADAWCKIAGLLKNNAPQNGKPFDEKILANLSWEYLETAKDMNSESDDVNWHLKNAKKLHDQGKYAGAIIDSIFVIETENATIMYNKNKKTAVEELIRLSSKERKSLWANVYASHGTFLLWNKQNATAYNLFKFAEGLDKANEKMLLEIRKSHENENYSEYFYAASIVIITVICIGIIVYLITKQKPNVFKKEK
ncbi:MAG: S16 family serine protease [Candidatus Micrarchaeota archaeon]